MEQHTINTIIEKYKIQGLAAEVIAAEIQAMEAEGHNIEYIEFMIKSVIDEINVI